jgi:hypothetical protein
LAAVRFQTEFGVTKSPNGLRQKLTVKEVGLLQNFCSSSPWSFWHHCASPNQERWILLDFFYSAKLFLFQEKLGVWQLSWQLGSWSSKILCHCSELAVEGTILDVIGSDYI